MRVCRLMPQSEVKPVNLRKKSPENGVRILNSKVVSQALLYFWLSLTLICENISDQKTLPLQANLEVPSS